MLLSKAVLSLARLCSTEESRYSMGSVAIEPEQAIVTNGHYLVTVAHTTMEPDSYPALSATQTNAAGLSSEKPLLLARDAALAALKAIKGLGKRSRNLPVLENAALCDDGKVYVSGLESVSAFSIGSQESRFPNWRAVMPSGAPQAEITLDAKYIRLLADYIAEHGDDRAAAMRLTIYGKENAIRIDARTAEHQDIIAVLMPLRADKHSFAARPSDVAEPIAEPVSEPVAA